MKGSGGRRQEGMEEGMDRIEVKAEGKRTEKNKNDEVKMYGLREGDERKLYRKGPDRVGDGTRK